MGQTSLEVQRLETLLRQHGEDMRRRAERGKALEAALQQARTSTFTEPTATAGPSDLSRSSSLSAKDHGLLRDPVAATTTERLGTGGGPAGSTLAVPGANEHAVSYGP